MYRTIRPINPKAATGLTARVYGQIKDDFAHLPPLALHSPAPEVFAAMWCMMRETLLAQGVSRANKEVVGAEISRVNRCPICEDIHSQMAVLASGGQINIGLGGASIEEIEDPLIREVIRWSAASNEPDSPMLRRPPFTDREAPQYIGTAVFFHYLNRMVNVFLSNADVSKWIIENPAGGPGLAMGGWLISYLTPRPLEPGKSLMLLDDDGLPSDMTWAENDKILGDAFGRVAKTFETIGKESVPALVRERFLKAVSSWHGKMPQNEMDTLDEVAEGLDERNRAAMRLVFLTGFASCQIDDSVVADFYEYFPDDRTLVGAAGWASFSVARKIGTWLKWH